MCMVTGQVCCKKANCVTDGADWLPVPVISVIKLESTVILDVSSCGNMNLLKGLRYGWRETPFEYLQAAVYSKVNSLPAAPFVWLQEADMCTDILYTKQNRWIFCSTTG